MRTRGGSYQCSQELSSEAAGPQRWAKEIGGRPPTMSAIEDENCSHIFGPNYTFAKY